MPNARIPIAADASSLLDYVSIGAESPRVAVSVRVASVLFVTVLTAALAQVSVPLPFTPVPVTLQPIVVLVGGAALGARLGATSQALYLILGAAGLPVFAASPFLPPGLARLMGPTGGYLLAYPIAALVTGWLADRGFDRRYVTSVIAMTAGLAVIFFGGVAWLAWLMPSGAASSGPIGLQPALSLGLYPFVLVDILKVLTAAAVMPFAWAALGRTRATG